MAVSRPSPHSGVPSGLRLGEGWKLGWRQDAECAISRAVAIALDSSRSPRDAQAANSRMVSDDPGPGQMYAIQARDQLWTPRRSEPGIRAEPNSQLLKVY